MSAFDVGKRHPGALAQMVHDVDRESTVKLHTANGDVDGKRGHAATIQVRSLLAKDVVVAVQSGPFGPGVDGLLGLSFLSRFKVSIDPQTVKIANRNAK